MCCVLQDIISDLSDVFFFFDRVFGHRAASNTDSRGQQALSLLRQKCSVKEHALEDREQVCGRGLLFRATRVGEGV